MDKKVQDDVTVYIEVGISSVTVEEIHSKDLWDRSGLFCRLIEQIAGWEDTDANDHVTERKSGAFCLVMYSWPPPWKNIFFYKWHVSSFYYNHNTP